MSSAEQSTLILCDDNELSEQGEQDEGNHGTDSNGFISMLPFPGSVLCFTKTVKKRLFPSSEFSKLKKSV